MLNLSQSAGYAIRALVHLDIKNKIRVRDLATIAGVPPAYLAKLFKKLGDAGIVESKRGWSGGTRLKRSPAEITLLQITEAIDDTASADHCLLGMEACEDERPCPLHAFWGATRGAIRNRLETTTLADVIAFEERAERPGEDQPRTL